MSAIEVSRLGLMLHRLRSLKPGWNGYTAPVPTDETIGLARRFAAGLSESSLDEPFVFPAIVPAVCGGVAITLKNGGRRAYVLFRNTGEAAVMLSDNESPPIVERVETNVSDFDYLIRRIRVYLNA